ncbi:MAG: hypothetical protein HND47_24775 [Chloroflexi bacterium]|nr:hypothetical protein [Chloroflexota bacterium]
MSTEFLEDVFPNNLESHFLLYKTDLGVLLGWCILTDVPAEEIDDHIDAAAQEWLSTEDGKAYLQTENLEEKGVDYAKVMANIPPEILVQYHIYPGIPIQEIIELDEGETFLSDETSSD